jgi:hypothetical protein
VGFAHREQTSVTGSEDGKRETAMSHVSEAVVFPASARPARERGS